VLFQAYDLRALLIWNRKCHIGRRRPKNGKQERSLRIVIKYPRLKKTWGNDTRRIDEKHNCFCIQIETEARHHWEEYRKKATEDYRLLSVGKSITTRAQTPNQIQRLRFLARGFTIKESQIIGKVTSPERGFPSSRVNYMHPDTFENSPILRRRSLNYWTEGEVFDLWSEAGKRVIAQESLISFPSRSKEPREEEFSVSHTT